ncbi:hypothetical protein QL285_036161 [Trifolium repens]|nr:hypothetical protein QL285_036161 [Trifolium repens]
MCSGCKDRGFGISYICENRNCNYIVHQECAAPVKQAVHPFFKNSNFVLYEKASKGGFCDACGKDLLGFSYICLKTGDALHPCCLNMTKEHEKESDDGKLVWKLCHEVPSDCVICKQSYLARNQFKGWSYVCDSNCIHVSCFNSVLEWLNNKKETTTADHQHTLQLNGDQAPSFMCSGCKELCGSGSTYICEKKNCNYIIHKECAEPVKFAVHPFFKDCNFEFNENVEKEYRGFCDACGKDLLGCYYICSKTRCALHPCCLNLPHAMISESTGEVIYKLCHEVPSDCLICKQRHAFRNKFEGWSYAFDSDGKSYVHVSCYQNFILEISNKKEETIDPPQLQSGGGSNQYLMPELTLEPDLTGGEIQKKNRTRSLLKFTGKLALKMVWDLSVGDVSSVGTIVEGVKLLMSD